MKFIHSLVLLLLISTHVHAQEKKPNILFIYTDDQAVWTIGANGNKQASTPNIDRLASEGANFKNAFVSTPVCSPARAALMTGRYASEFSIADFIPQPGHRLYDPENEVGLDPASITFPEVLSDNGYTTGLIGKWHLGDWTADPSNKYHPTNNGYDYFMGLTGGGTSPVDPPLEKNGEVKTFKGLTTDILTDEAIEFLKRNSDKPFLLSVHYRAPHGAWLPVAEADWEPYKDLDPDIPNPDFPDLDVERVKRMMREYLASVSGVDRNVGRLLYTLDMLNIADNTIVIFTSDHGYNMGHNGIFHKGNGIWVTKHLPPKEPNIGQKYRPNLYDLSLRVPVIVRWPDVVEPGTKVSEIVSSLDWFPTLLEMAGADMPKGKIVRGRSMVPLLKGETVNDWRTDIYAEYSMINYAQSYMRAYRTKEWKLVEDFRNPERDELYNIAKDPEENINLIYDSRQSVKDIKKELDREIKNHMNQLNDSLLDTLSVN
ncbi:sulfatase family protein [Rhodohalobacter sp. 614A]|uniref:sulfatase family protein n=1 Tax=Rhodohalobacter sp. 614A TaxID=2908649 RepID=UPI001F46C05A|nr:sulfatase-like hydrolase/transferase [Rhodohalobacter sp. 614A]